MTMQSPLPSLGVLPPRSRMSTRITRSNQALSRDEVRNQIEATIKHLRPAAEGDLFAAAELERDKQQILEDFQIEDDAEFRALVLSYEPHRR